MTVVNNLQGSQNKPGIVLMFGRQSFRVQKHAIQ